MLTENGGCLFVFRVSCFGDIELLPFLVFLSFATRENPTDGVSIVFYISLGISVPGNMLKHRDHTQPRVPSA